MSGQKADEIQRDSSRKVHANRHFAQVPDLNLKMSAYGKMIKILATKVFANCVAWKSKFVFAMIRCDFEGKTHSRRL